MSSNLLQNPTPWGMGIVLRLLLGSLLLVALLLIDSMMLPANILNMENIFNYYKIVAP